MQIKDRELPAEPDWGSADDPLALRLISGFRSGNGFAPSRIGEDETLSGNIDFPQEPEELEEKDRVGEATVPRIK
jgi:hypothetical protein